MKLTIFTAVVLFSLISTVTYCVCFHHMNFGLTTCILPVPLPYNLEEYRVPGKHSLSTNQTAYSAVVVEWLFLTRYFQYQSKVIV